MVHIVLPLLTLSKNSKHLSVPVDEWVETGIHPDVSETAAVKLSMPLIALAQLCQYSVSTDISGLDMLEFNRRFMGTLDLFTSRNYWTQSRMISAVIVSISNDYDSFVMNAKKGVQLLAAIGNETEKIAHIIIATII